MKNIKKAINKYPLLITSLILVVFSLFLFLISSSDTTNRLLSNFSSFDDNQRNIFLSHDSDNLYLFSDESISDEINIKVRYIDGTESDLISVGNSGIGDSNKGYTSEILTFSNYVDKVMINSESSEHLSLGKINNGYYSLTTFEGAVLGVSSEREESEILFLEKIGFDVATRDDWDNSFIRDIEEVDEKYVDLQEIYIYSLDNLNPGSDLEKVRTVLNYQKQRCISVPGIAPLSCDEKDTWDDISFNYILGSDGLIYQGKIGGNGVSGTHMGKNDNSISIAVVPDDFGVYDQSENLKKLIVSLSTVNGIKIQESSIEFVNVNDSGNFDELSRKTRRSIQDDISDETIEKIEAIDEITESENIVRVGEKVQLLVPKDSTDVTKEIVSRVTDLDLDSQSDYYETQLIDEDVAEQIVAETIIVEGEPVVQPNYIYRLESWDNTSQTRSIPSDYDVNTHWYLEKINVPEAWNDLGGCSSDNTCGGSNSVTVAVLDTGVAYENYDYDGGGTYTAATFDPFYVEVPSVDTQNGIYNEGYDREYDALPELSNVTFVDPYDSWQDYSCNSLRLSGSTPDPCNTFELAKITHANDDHGHGTFVTSIIAANTGDLSPNRIVGLAHNIQIMPVKVFTPNDNSMCIDYWGYLDLTCSYANGDYRAIAFTTTIVDGINHAVSNGANVINMSLSGPGTDTLVEDAINTATAADILVVVAAGNEGEDAQFYFPANASGAFTVGASNPNDTKSSYSNYGSVIDLVAPVGDFSTSKVSSIRYACSTANICSDETNPNLFQSFTSTSVGNLGVGTSYAAPQVSAAAALFWSAKPSSTMDEVKAALINSATDLGTPGFDQNFGWGLLNIGKSLKNDNVWFEVSNRQKNSQGAAGDTFSRSDSNLVLELGDYLVNSDPEVSDDEVDETIPDDPTSIEDESIVIDGEEEKIYRPNIEYFPDESSLYIYAFDTVISDLTNSWLEFENQDEVDIASINIFANGSRDNSYDLNPKERSIHFIGAQNNKIVIISSNDISPLLKILSEGEIVSITPSVISR